LTIKYEVKGPLRKLKHNGMIILKLILLARQLVTDPQQRPQLNPRPVHGGFVADKMV